LLLQIVKVGTFPIIPFAPNYADDPTGFALTDTVAEQIGNARNTLFISQRPTTPT
jgi:hypothetical protein